MASYVLLEQARHIAALVLDVDGILSDGFVTLTGREDKGTALREACAQLNIDPEDCLYMGDDSFAIAGMKVTVPNGHVEVRRRADLVTQALGGRGAVREICDMLLMSKGVYQELLEKYTRAPY